MENYKKAIEMYKNNKSLRTISICCGIGRHKLKSLFMRDGYIEYMETDKDREIVEDIKSKNTLDFLKKKYGIGRTKINELKVVYGLLREKNKYEYDFKLLRIDSEFKFYVLGYIYSDGCIDGNYIRFGCSIKDIDILKKINDNLTISNNKDKKLEIKKELKSVFLRYCDSNLSNYLRKEYDLKENKSLTCKVPKDSIPKKYMKHFARGLFDGDGGIHESGIISFCGSLDVVEWFTSFIRDNVDIQYSSTISKNSSIYQVRFTSKKDAKKVLKFLYEDSSIYIDRKHTKYLELNS